MGRRATTVDKTLSFTHEMASVLDGLRAQGASTSVYVENVLRLHFDMPPRPDVASAGHRWQPGESGNPAGKRPREAQGEPSGDGPGQDTPGEDGPL